VCPAFAGQSLESRLAAQPGVFDGPRLERMTAPDGRRLTHVLERRLSHLAAGLPGEDDLTKWGAVLAATWLYIHTFVYLANGVGPAAHASGVAFYLFVIAASVGFIMGPVWICATLPSLFVSRRPVGGGRTRLRALFAVVVSLIGIYGYLCTLD